MLEIQVDCTYMALSYTFMVTKAFHKASHSAFQAHTNVARVQCLDQGHFEKWTVRAGIRTVVRVTG